MKTVIITFFAFFALLGCQRKESLSMKLTEDVQITHPGKELMETYCYVCHKPEGSSDRRLAPPMEMVKNHYYQEGMTREDFITDIKNWVDKPDEEHARMFGAIRNFGLMPKQDIPEENLELIAEYLFEFVSDDVQNCGQHGRGMGRQRMKHNKS